jgi:hypothetical protein
LNVPAGIATSSNFDLAIADFGSNVIRGVTASNGNIATVAGQPEFGGYFGNGIPAKGPTLADNAVVNTNNIWIDAAGNGFLADTDNCVVRKIDTTGTITTIAGTEPVPTSPGSLFSTPQCGFAGAGGPALSAKLGKITGVATDSVGNVYFSDSTNNVIWVRAGVTTTTPARTAGSVYIISTGTTLDTPTGMFVDSFDNLYFADTKKHVIREIPGSGPNAGVLTIVAGTVDTPGFSPDGTVATAAELDGPFGVFVDGAGNVFISDTNNNVIREVAAATGGGKNKGSIYTVVGTGTAGFNGDGIAATTAQINVPKGMAQGASNSLLFSDSANNRVRSVANLTSHPSLTVSKLSLDFGNQPELTASAPQAVVIKNVGAASITLGTATITGTNAADFAVTSTCNGVVVAPGATCTVNVTFTPSTTALEQATLTISDTVPESRIISLTGTGVLGIPGATVTPPSLTFALQAVGTTSTTGQDVTVTNNGTAALTISSITFTPTGSNPAAGDFTQTNTCSTPVAVGNHCTITVKFAPTAAGTRTASLSIADDAVGSPQLVALTGTAALPTADLSATTLAFGDQVTNTASATKTVTLTNHGTVPLTLSAAIAITGDFSQTNDCGTSVATGAHCTITVKFTPTTTGARNGTITITDNAAPPTQTITLTGNGVAANPTVTLTGAPVSFADQLVGTTSAVAPVTLKNTGATALAITGITIGGANAGDFSQTNDCGTSVAANATCTISVKFAPTAAGARAGTITIADNTNPANQTIAVSGNGVVVALGAAANGSTSQTVKAGATATYALQLSATGGASTDQFSVTFACTGAPSKATCTAPATAVVVSPGTPQAVTVTVSTTAASMFVPQSEPNVQGPAALRFLPLTVVSLLLCIAAMFAWMHSPAGRMRAVRLAVTACLVLMPVAAGTLLTGCASSGGGSGSTTPPAPVPGTPSGTYTVTVTSTVNGHASTTPLTLIVQ